MTCVIGYKTDDGIWMGADSLGSNDWGLAVSCAVPKVFVNGPMMFGTCGSFRMAQLLRYVLDFERMGHPAGMADHEYLVRYFVEEVRSVLTDGGFTHIKNNVEEAGLFIVSYNGGLYTIDDDFQVFISANPFQAIGSGGEVALGAMHILDQYDVSPEEAITEALKAAVEHNAYVRGPFVIRKHIP